ncbi:MAG: Pyrrolo-quinoline quinone [Caulobacteraceae bacterium]|nr:Pyrrolo-quinoline quinone [Caulobacteraceae bacterium]
MIRKSLMLSVATAIAAALFQPVSAQDDAPPNTRQVAPPAAPAGRPNQRANITPVTQADLNKPAGDEWLSYHGSYTGNHYSTLSQINATNVTKLKRAWTSDVDEPFVAGRSRLDNPVDGVQSGETGAGSPYAPGSITSGLLMRSGVIFYTSGVNAYAVDARTGKQIWHYIGRSFGGLTNRGMGLAGDKLFVLFNGGLTAIDATTGKELWSKPYGGPTLPMAPLIVRDHVYVTAGGDGANIRGFLESLNANIGEQEWIYYTTPKEGEFGFNTWPSEAEAAVSNGSAWQTPTYDPETNLLIYGTGNPTPIRDGRQRPGDNLFSDSTLALNADTGKMAWYFQATPNDDHDYDNNQGMNLADITIGGKPRKVVTWVSRNGYQYTIDRLTGENIVTRKLLDTANWAKPKLRSSGEPEKDQNKAPSRGGAIVSPNSNGFVNYPAQSFSPQTGLLYTNTNRSISVYYWGGEEMLGNARTALVAIDPATGRTVWQHLYPDLNNLRRGFYPSVLTTAGGLLFTGDISGNFIAYDDRTGKILWHDELPDSTTFGLPISYRLDGKQYVLTGAGPKLIAYTLN